MCLSALVDVSSFCLFYSNCTISVYSFSANALKLMRRRCCCCCYCETYDHCVWCVVCSSGHQMVSAVVRLICSPRSVSGDSAKRAREWRQRKEDATANWWLVSLKRRAFNQSEQRHQTEETAHDDDDHDASRHFNITDSDVEQGKLYSSFSFFTLSLSLWCHRQCRLETSTTHIIPPFWPNCPFLISFFPSFYRSKFCFDF